MTGQPNSGKRVCDLVVKRQAFESLQIVERSAIETNGGHPSDRKCRNRCALYGLPCGGSPAKTSSDGVACEACHGPAEKWLGTHTQADSHTASVAVGMIDTKVLRSALSTCLSCHLGTKEKS